MVDDIKEVIKGFEHAIKVVEILTEKLINKNESKEFIKEHLLTTDDITDNILKDMYADEGIIITTENGRIIDIDASWSECDEYEDCWNVRVYESYEEYIKC